MNDKYPRTSMWSRLFFVSRQAAEAKKKNSIQRHLYQNLVISIGTTLPTTSAPTLSVSYHSLYIYTLSLPSADHCGNIHSYRLYHSNLPRQRSVALKFKVVRCIEHSITGTPYMNKVLSRSILDRPNLPYIPDRPITSTQCTSISNSNTFIFTLCICNVASLRIASRIIKVRPSVYPFRLFCSKASLPNLPLLHFTST